MSVSSEIDIRLATENDYESIQDGFRRYYWPEEPLSAGYKITKPSEIEEQFFFCVPAKGYSLIAMDPDQDNKVIGFLTNDIFSSESMTEFAERLQGHFDERLDAMKGIFNKLNDEADFLEKCGDDKIFLMFNLGVDPAARGRSVGKKLFQRALELANSLGFKAAGVDCTGIFSTRIAKQLDMECIGKVCYKDYTDESGEPVFKPLPIHTHMSRFIKFL